MSIDYAELRVELEADPKELGYTGNNDVMDAELLNGVGASGEKVKRDFIDGQEIMSVVEISEYAELSQIQRDGWLAIISAGTGMVDVNNPGTIAQVEAIWSGTTTIENLIAMRKRDASRAEVLFGHAVTDQDVGKARQL